VRVVVSNEAGRRYGGFSLEDKYTAETGIVTMSGIQALVRLALDQHRADRRSGLNTATLISGYRGSPLGGLDIALERAAAHLQAHHVRFLPAINEDLAAAAVFGSQLANNYPAPRYDGVLGMWYGKGPGVDRSGDVFKHANFAGVGRHGGVLAIAGDDPGAKSSTIPSASEVALFDAQMPVLYPGNVQEILELGLRGFALSRYTGSWVGLKIVTNTADEFSSVTLAARPLNIVHPEFQYSGKPWCPSQNPALLAPWSLEQEREMHEGRIEAANRFAAANEINCIPLDPPAAWIGIACAGKVYYDVMEALWALGIDAVLALQMGIRVLKLGMISPLDHSIAKRFARGLEEIVVVEEKRSFVELLLRDCLYGVASAPRIVGKKDDAGAFLFPGYGELDSDSIRERLRSRLLRRIGADRMRSAPASDAANLIALAKEVIRTPYFCSGCPHNRSTEVPAGSLANGAVGCSTMAMWMDRETSNIVHMGGEGVQWVGASFFSATPHIFQNMGDGTFIHSGSLAIRQAVAARTSITYKLLYNAAVAMTGGQQHDAELSVADIARALLAEGVSRLLIVTHQPDAYRSQTLPPGVDVWHRERLNEAQTVLRAVAGVTVLLYEQPCAANLRRDRKRGLAEIPAHRVLINEAVCEGCGDCGRKSNCLSVQPVDTPFGRKTQVHQSSCNQDFTCTDGHCPSFLLVEPSPGFRPAGMLDVTSLEQVNLPDPELRVGDTVNILMTGIGGTGVVTVNQILGVAARLQGSYSSGLDQTGLAQKGGSVVSHLKIAPTAIGVSNLIGFAQSDVLLAFDLVTAVHGKHLGRNKPGQTIAVVNTSVVPTGPQIRGVDGTIPSADFLIRRIENFTNRAGNVYLDADKLSIAAFGDHMPANMIIVGAAYQAGLLPLDWQNIERAIDHNGSAAKINKQAFRLGRKLLLDPTWGDFLVSGRPTAVPRVPVLSEQAQMVFDASGVPQPIRNDVLLYFSELIAYQSLDYASTYLRFVVGVLRQELENRFEVAAGVAKSLCKLMAYKDEYEVARLHLLPAFDEMLTRQYGSRPRRRYLLQPPFLKFVGIERKLAFGTWVRWIFRALVAIRCVRGTPFDVFGWTRHRRLERALVGEYRTQMQTALQHMAADNYERIVALADGPQRVCGFDSVKERNVALWRQMSARLLADIESAAKRLTKAAPGTPLQ
jgi:indolepyruvate ferredoxin oxidoreductase